MARTSGTGTWHAGDIGAGGRRGQRLARAVQEGYPRGEGSARRRAAASDEREGRREPSQAAGIPAEDGVGLASVQVPLQLGRQFQPGRPRRGCARPAKEGLGPRQLGLDIGAEVECEADVVTAADFVDDIDAARDPVEPDAATVPRGRLERQVAVVLGGPRRDLAGVGDVDLPGLRVTQPEEGAAVAGLVPAIDLRGVVRDRPRSSEKPGTYFLSMGHMSDLTLESFAYSRLPLVVAGIALAIGAIGAWRLRGERALLAMALMMAIFFQAARLALVVFDPYLSSRPIAEALNRVRREG